MPSSRLLCVTLSALLTVNATLSHAQDQPTPRASASTVTVYPASFFAGARTYSAFDMLDLLPGYEFEDSDTDVRGLAGAAGNVLIDGSRPASKYESLEDMLRRIPAEGVERIELIRAGTPGVNMQGHSMLANIVRTHAGQTRGSVEIGDAVYERGFDAPRIAGELTRRTGDRLVELSGAVYETVDDEHGAGRRPRISPQGDVLRDGSYSQDEGEKIASAAGGYEDAVFDGKLRLHGSLQQTRFRADIRDAVTIPEIAMSTVTEFDEETSSELGLHFGRALSAPMELEVFAIRRNLRSRGGERSAEADQSSLFRDDSDASESIVRALVRRHGDAFSLEGGLEMALNTLDSRTSLTENSIEVAIPSAIVRVEERRSEAFITGTWTLSPAWNLELGSRFEYSELTQSGDATSSKSFFFPKPRALLTWSQGANQVHLLAERTVGQLDFEDFVSSASLTSGTVTAGNPDLEPDRTRRIELAWERRVLQSGSIGLALRHDDIDDLIDRVPVIADSVFDAIGNIGAGTREEIALDVTLPLDRIGIAAAVLKATAEWRHSRTRDPVTGESRMISEEEPFEGELHFQQSLARWNARWGIDLILASEESEYHFDEIRTDRLGTMLNVFAEYEPSRYWNVRLFVSNLTDRSAVRERQRYDGMRDTAPLRYVETRTLNIGTYASVQVRRKFGE